MRLVVSVEGWLSQDRRPGARFVTYTSRGVGLLVSDVLPFPEEPEAWLRRALADDTPVGAVIDETGLTSFTTEAGWPVRLLDGEVVAGDARERRMVALYRFLDWGGAVIVRGADELVAPRKDELLQLIKTTRPDLGGAGPVCLAELFDGLVTPPRPDDAAGVGE